MHKTFQPKWITNASNYSQLASLCGCKSGLIYLSPIHQLSSSQPAEPGPIKWSRYSSIHSQFLFLNMQLIDAFTITLRVTFFFAVAMQTVRVNDHSLTKSVNLASTESLELCKSQTVYTSWHRSRGKAATRPNKCREFSFNFTFS